MGDAEPLDREDVERRGIAELVDIRFGSVLFVEEVALESVRRAEWPNCACCCCWYCALYIEECGSPTGGEFELRRGLG